MIERKLESATFANHDGAHTLTIIVKESAYPGNEVLPGRLHKDYRLVSRLSHYGMSTETTIPFGNAAVVGWLRDALSRVEPQIQASQSDWAVDFVGNGDVTVHDGHTVTRELVVESESMSD